MHTGKLKRTIKRQQPYSKKSENNVLVYTLNKSAPVFHTHVPYFSISLKWVLSQSDSATGIAYPVTFCTISLCQLS